MRGLRSHKFRTNAYIAEQSAERQRAPNKEEPMNRPCSDQVQLASVPVPEETAAALAHAAQELIVQYVERGNSASELLSEAQRLAQRALALASAGEPAVLAAQLVLCDAARLGGENGRAVEAMYAKVLAEHPASAKARLGLGLLYLVWNPAQAVAQFSMGEKLDSIDPVYSLNLARACLKLNQHGLAAVALSRARAKEPSHPDIQALQQQISQRGYTAAS
jgi:hypothetical protein